MSTELTESTRQILTTLVAQHGRGRELEGLKDVCDANRAAALQVQCDGCDAPGRTDQLAKAAYWTRVGTAVRDLAGRVIHTETVQGLRS